MLMQPETHKGLSLYYDFRPYGVECTQPEEPKHPQLLSLHHFPTFYDFKHEVGK